MKAWSSACFVTGAHIDLAGRLFAPPVPAVSNPGRLHSQPGGVGLNTASVAAALGIDATLAGPVGEDGEAAILRQTVARRGIGDALIALEGAPTGVYAAIIAPDGEMVIGLADLAIYEAVDAAWLARHCGAALNACDLWFLSANQTAQTLADLADAANGKLLAAATISPAKAPRLKAIAGRLDLLFTNVSEARVLAGLPDAGAGELCAALMAMGVKAGTISAAAGPLVHWQDGETGSLAPPPVETIADVNGAGDALAGTVLAGLAQGRSMAEAAALGIAASQLTLGVPEPFHEGLEWPLLEALAAGIALGGDCG